MLLPAPKRLEIDHHTMKLIVGIIALSLASLTSFFSGNAITSISASYHEGGWAQNFFVGFLFAIAAFLLAYNGYSRPEMVASKVAALAALAVALFPCNCDGHAEIIPRVHTYAAAVMFLILAYFCYGFYCRARKKAHSRANVRAGIYAVCGVVIVFCIAVIAFDNLTDGAASARIARLTFYAERGALIAFGISWLTASRVLPGITRPEERFSPLSDKPAA